MSKIFDYTRNVSLRLSKVLDEIEVNERMVIKQRRLQLMNVKLHTIGSRLTLEDMNVYYLGSRVEGTTTIGLESDTDILITLTGVKVIQDWSEWEPGKRNLLMIQDDTVSPGYFLLQILRQDAPLPKQNVYDQHAYRDRKGRVLLKNSIVNPAADDERVRHGPARSRDGSPGFFAVDFVTALTCQQWPLQARQWINQQGEGQWPTNDMKQYCKGTGCFVVGVGSKGSVNEGLEWRISTSLAERLVEIDPEHKSCMISGALIRNAASIVNDLFTPLLIKTNEINHIRFLLKTLYKYLMKVAHDMNQGQNKLAYSAIAKFLSLHLGSALVSINIQSRRGVCRESIVLMSLGQNIDVASGKLKLASIFYCTGDIERTELILKNVAESYDVNIVEPICMCYTFQKCKYKNTFNKLCYEADNEYSLLQSITASCVRFLRCEINCCPYELQHEMFRSSQEDFLYRSKGDEWMDLAVVDSLPYLYFLRYKTYSQLRRHQDKQAAISNLAKCIVEESNFGHKETALNLLGQCMEQENRMDAALKCYLLSLKIRGKHNAAKFHICRLVSSMLVQGLH